MRSAATAGHVSDMPLLQTNKVLAAKVLHTLACSLLKVGGLFLQADHSQPMQVRHVSDGLNFVEKSSTVAFMHLVIQMVKCPGAEQSNCMRRCSWIFSRMALTCG